MSRKSFLIWGLVIIHLVVTAKLVVMYLTLSKIIDLKAVGSTIDLVRFLLPLVAFGIILHFRFKEFGRRKRILALCLPFYILSLGIGGYLAIGYLVFDVFGAHDRFFGAVKEWSALADPKPATPWSVTDKLDYFFFNLPAIYLSQLGLFALLWFGSLDPRKPSKNKVIAFLKHSVGRKTPNPAAA